MTVPAAVVDLVTPIQWAAIEATAAKHLRDPEELAAEMSHVLGYDEPCREDPCECAHPEHTERVKGPRGCDLFNARLTADAGLPSLATRPIPAVQSTVKEDLTGSCDLDAPPPTTFAVTFTAAQPL